MSFLVELLFMLCLLLLCFLTLLGHVYLYLRVDAEVLSGGKCQGQEVVAFSSLLGIKFH